MECGFDLSKSFSFRSFGYKAIETFLGSYFVAEHLNYLNHLILSWTSTFICQSALEYLHTCLCNGINQDFLELRALISLLCSFAALFFTLSFDFLHFKLVLFDNISVMCLYTLNIVLDLTAHALRPNPHIKQIFQECLELSIMSEGIGRYFSVN